MKIRMKVSVLLAVMALSSVAHAKDLRVVSGSCRLETSDETIELKNVDSGRLYGTIALGSSKEGFNVYLTQNFHNSVDINILANGNVSYSIVALEKDGVTRIRHGIVVRRPDQTGEWLSCDLGVQ